MSDRRAGWFVVIVSAALGAVVTVISASVLRTALIRPEFRLSESWLNGALSALSSTAQLIVMVVVLDNVALVIGKDLWIRITAAIVTVATVLGVMAVGGAAALTTAPFVAEPAGPGAFDCTDPAMQRPPGMQEAVDELIHPGHVDTIPMAVESCRGIVRLWPVVDAVPEYRFQLENAGWTIDSDDDTWLTAHRGEFTFTVSSCGDETAIEIRLTTAAATIWC
jgi:hypothetical protein